MTDATPQYSVKIEAMSSLQFKQVEQLLHRYSTTESDFVTLHRLKQLYGPLQWVSQLLPQRWQFVPSVFIARTKNQVLGVLWLHRDGHHPHRWRIEQLILDPEHSSMEVGKLLVEYVVNQYGASGVEQFTTDVPHHHEDAQAILKEAGFRQIGRAHVFRYEPGSEALKNADPVSIIGLREFRGRDAQSVHTLQIDSLPTTCRLYLDRHAKDFKQSFIRKCQCQIEGVFYKQWVIEHHHSDFLKGYISIFTHNYKHFSIQLIISPGWEDGFKPALQFLLERISQQSSSPVITNRSYGFHDYQHASLEELGFIRQHENLVLAKDYWTPLQGNTPLKAATPLLLLDGAATTPCVKMTNG